MNREFIARIGTFSLVIGVWIFVLFVASEFSGDANFDYLFWAVLAVSVGLIMRRRREPRPHTERFSYVRKLRTRKHPEKGKK
ncbi:MAG TPA: hypothetical protein VMJ64_09655 [Anaerolineales bacterium]|nr:hypothetical protein [Anaerolineales bacterium]